MCHQLVAEFTIPDDAEAPKLPEARVVSLGSLSLCFHDSFDWRLYRAGFEWIHEAAGSDSRTVCIERKSGHRWTVAAGRPPRFADDFPAGEWRERLTAALEPRAVECRLELTGERRTLIFGDGGGESPRLELERWTLPANGGDCSLPPRARLIAPASAHKSFRRMVEWLAETSGFEPARSLLDEALVHSGRVPEDPAALPVDPLDPHMRADAAVKKILAHLLYTIEVVEPGVLLQTDTEFLHDYRVAVRRTRTALGQIRDVFPERDRTRFLQGFSSLALVTSEARDLDVYLLQLPAQESQLPAALGGQLESLRDLLERRSEVAQHQLCRHLRSSHHLRLLDQWRRFLETPTPRRPRAERALLPVADVVGARIWKVYRRLLREGRAITPATPPENLHELRKTAKKLRYLLELFRNAYPPEQVRVLVKILKRLQDVLGEYQDLHIQLGRLREFSAELRGTDAPLDTLLAIGALVGNLHHRERVVRQDFDRRFADFAENHHQRRFRNLFKPIRKRPP